jgi:hypothetical protein
MTSQEGPRPGAHNHVEGTPEESFAYVAECGHEPIIPIGVGVAIVDPCPRCGSKVTFSDVSPEFTVRFRYKRKGHPRAALESILKGIHPSVFETEILDEH